MDKRKGIILAVIIFLLIGLGTFIFANPSEDSLKGNDNSTDKSNDTKEEDLDNENTNDGLEEEGGVENKPNSGNNGGDHNGNDQSQNSSTPSEPTTPSIPEEPVVDTSYEDALAAVVKAEGSLSQSDVDSALALVNALEEGNEKTGLASRIQAVQNLINATSAVLLAETTFTQKDVNIANALINTLSDSDHKTGLTNRINSVQDTINVASLIEDLQEMTESVTDKTDLDQAREFRADEDVLAKVASLGESTKKEELLDTLNSLALILDDTTAPVVSGILNNEIINDASVISITDTNEVTILLNGIETDFEDLTQNLLLDGEYTLVVIDKAFNSSEAITFEIDKTAPKITGLDNAIYVSDQNTYIYNGNLNIKISDANLVSVEGIDEEIVNGTVSHKIGNGTRHIIATDAAGNKMEVTITVDKDVTDFITITNDEELTQAIKNQRNSQYWIINEGKYTLLPGEDYIAEGGQMGWFFPITADNLTIVGNGDVIIEAGVDVVNGNWSTQNFVTIWGDNFKISNVTLIAQNETNKAVEILGNNVVLENIVIDPRDNDDDYSGSIYVNNPGTADNPVTTTLRNVTLNKGRITLTGTNAYNTVYLTNVTADLAGSSTERAVENSNGGVDIYASFNNTGGAKVIANNFTVTVSDRLAVIVNNVNIMQEVFNQLPDGTKVIFSDGEYNVDYLNIQNILYLEGTSKESTIFNVSQKASGQAGILITNSGSISNLTINKEPYEVENTSDDAIKITYHNGAKVSNYTISNILVTGGESSINIHGVENAIINGVMVLKPMHLAVSVASSNVVIMNSYLDAGAWGSAGIMHGSDTNIYPTGSVVEIGDGNTIISQYIYSEGYEEGYENRNSFVNRDKEELAYTPFGDKKYYQINN